MRKIAKVPLALLSILMVLMPVSVSTCDLSCWLHKTSSDCHSASSVDSLRMTPRSSEMDMNAYMEMSFQDAHNKAGSYDSAQDSTHHLMVAQMDMVRSARQVINKTDESGRTGFDHSRALSPCSDETCSKTATSISPPSASQEQSVYLHCAVIDVSYAANLLTRSHQIPSGSPPPPLHSADLLPTLRV